MKRLKTILLIAALSTSVLAGEPHRKIPVHGSWDQWNPIQFHISPELQRGRSYTIANHTGQTIYVMAVEGHSPLDYFPLGDGESRQFGAPWNLQGDTYELDLFLDAGTKLNGNTITPREGPELVTEPTP